MAKTVAEHWRNLSGEVQKGADEADFKRIISAASALRRARESGRSDYAEISARDCVMTVKGKAAFIHVGDFFGEITSMKGNKITANQLKKRELSKMISEIPEDSERSFEAIPDGVEIQTPVRIAA